MVRTNRTGSYVPEYNPNGKHASLVIYVRGNTNHYDTGYKYIIRTVKCLLLSITSRSILEVDYTLLEFISM